ncbi:MAG: GYD domain-containing protein [Methanomicrobiales archaeon]|nr:GYD domain-containing protein [Methanomicrobiales archaeon]
MYFVVLAKFKKKPTKEVVAQNMKMLEMGAKEGVKNHGIYWTLGRYDAVGIFEAPNEKVAMKHAIRLEENVASETMIAIPVEEARKLAE